MNKGFIPTSKSSIKSFTNLKNIVSEKEHGFTLIELIVVIIIVGILAAMGITQYSKTVERGRGVELRTNIGAIRQFAYNFYLENGTCFGMTTSDVNIGSASDQIPSACSPSHYFYYSLTVRSPTLVFMAAYRCTSGGKSPQGPENCYTRLNETFSTGAQSWLTNCTGVRY